MSNDNLDLIGEFGVRNQKMADDAPNVDCDPRTGRLWTHLEMRVLRDVVLRRLTADRRAGLRVLDVGAGTGRMTGELAKIAAQCVAIEPFPKFYERLHARFASTEVKVERCTLGEYAKAAGAGFDMIYASGVLLYLNDDELRGFVQEAKRLLLPDSFLVIREPTFANADLADDGRQVTGPNPTAAAERLYYRKQEDLIAAVEAEGLRAVHDGRAYPINLAAMVRQRWPNALTGLMYKSATAPVTYPLWDLWGRMNLRPRSGLFWMFAFQNEDELTPL